MVLALDSSNNVIKRLYFLFFLQKCIFGTQLKYKQCMYFAGSTKKVSGLTEVIGGSMVDDGQWHDIIILREKKNVIFVVDRLETVFQTNGLFFKLDLDKMVGSLPSSR